MTARGFRAFPAEKCTSFSNLCCAGSLPATGNTWKAICRCVNELDGGSEWLVAELRAYNLEWIQEHTPTSRSYRNHNSAQSLSEVALTCIQERRSSCAHVDACTKPLMGQSQGRILPLVLFSLPTSGRTVHIIESRLNVLSHPANLAELHKPFFSNFAVVAVRVWVSRH